MLRCLVTGGAGFIGSHVAQQLVSDGHEVTILDDLTGGFRQNVPAGARFIEGSVTDPRLVNDVVRGNRIEYIFHLAAYAAEGLSHFIKRFNYINNLIGSVNLLNAAVNHGIRCFVFTSSIAVYGPAQLPMTEELVPSPEDSYGIAKFAVEQELKVTHEMFGLDYIVFRPHNVYGENQNIGDKYRNVIGIFMNQAMQGMPMTIFGDGNQTRAFTYIADVAPIIARSIEVPQAYNSVFNIGADIPYTINQLAEIVCKHMDCELKVRHLEARKEVLHAFSSHTKVESVFNYKAQWSLDQGISRMAAWAKRAGPRQSKPFEEIEIRKNLPKTWDE
jgi:UDP-glucose 4-epimerase